MNTLEKLHACSEAVTWAAGRPLRQVWPQCVRGDWMLWLADRAGISRDIQLAAGRACVNAVMTMVFRAEDRVALETIEAWSFGDATLAEVRFAANRANNAVVDAAYAVGVGGVGGPYWGDLEVYAAAHATMAKVVRGVISWASIREGLNRPGVSQLALKSWWRQRQRHQFVAGG